MSPTATAVTAAAAAANDTEPSDSFVAPQDTATETKAVIKTEIKAEEDNNDKGNGDNDGPTDTPQDTTTNIIKEDGNTKINAAAAEANHPKEEEQPQEEECEEEEAESTFPQQLMDVIDAESKEGCGVHLPSTGLRVIEWLPEGKSFTIRDKGKLEKEVLPKYFNAKCKFMSFVRKLYRWGFRQVDKTMPSGMVFTHTNFVRGQRKRCLMMRSIVKKQNTSQHGGGGGGHGQHQGMGGGQGGSHNHHHPIQIPQGMNNNNGPYGAGGMGGMMSAMAGGMGGGNVGGDGYPTSSMLQSFGANTGQYGGMGGMMSGMGGGGMGGMGGGSGNNSSFGPPLFPQQARQVSFPGGNSGYDHSSSQGGGGHQGGGGGDIHGRFGAGMGNHNQGGPTGSSLMGMGGMTSRDVFEAGLRLERMEREQQQMHHQGGMGNNTMPPSMTNGSGGTGFSGNSNHYHGNNSTSFSPPMGMPNNMGGGSGSNYGSSAGTLGESEMSQIEVASQLMKRDPSMEPWRALEMAKQFNNGSGGASTAGSTGNHDGSKAQAML